MLALASIQEAPDQARCNALATEFALGPHIDQVAVSHAIRYDASLAYDSAPAPGETDRPTGFEGPGVLVRGPTIVETILSQDGFQLFPVHVGG